jgi:nitrogen fixation/metabolism regulation signal transduction histidine kinase
VTARTRRENVRLGVQAILILCAAAGTAMLYLLAKASANTSFLSEHHTLLLGLNAVVVACLLGLVVYLVVALSRRLRARRFGSKLTLRLVLFFSLAAVLPGTLVYAVSVKFLGTSIDSWFTVKVDRALEGGINLGRNSLDSMLKDLAKIAEAMSAALAERPEEDHLGALNTLREQAQVQEASLFNHRGQVLAFSGSERAELLPQSPAPMVLRQVRAQQPYTSVESDPEKGLFLRAAVPVNMFGFTSDVLILQLLHPVPPHLAADAELIQTGYRDYQELLLSRPGLKKLFGLTLTLTLLLALLSALVLAFLFSERLSAPLSILAEGTRAVAKGDFSQREASKSHDELGVLTQSFNSMTRQLEDARASVQRREEELSTAKGFLESILASLSAGVLVFDEELKLRSSNPSAGRMLGVDPLSLHDTSLSQWNEKSLKAVAETILSGFRDSPAWEKQVEFAGKSGNQVLLARGTRLPGGSEGYVIVFDDITHLLQAQRYAAWGEVARRLAHEIKNPLTPIQLSAERLQRKLGAKLAQGEADVLQRATSTIVTQVGALKHMVDAFSQYAKLPEPRFAELDCNQVLREVIAMYEASNAPVQLALEAEVPLIRGDAAQLRQLLHNLLQNGLDSVAGVAQPSIVARTHARADAVLLSVEDNGPGFPDALINRAFEPYVTTKEKGTGLGLAIVKKIVEEHHGSIHVENISPNGARVSVYFPAAPEVQLRQVS